MHPKEMGEKMEKVKRMDEEMGLEMKEVEGRRVSCSVESTSEGLVCPTQRSAP